MAQPSTTPDLGWMGDPKRGASLGRPQRLGSALHRDNRILFHLARIRLDRGGYDPGGAYWGHSGELYEAWDDHGEAYMTFRVYPQWGGGREAAKAQVRLTYPNARFYR